MNSFKELKVWIACRDLRNLVWDCLNQLPNDEKYRLGDQMIRASRSAANQIAEGFGRYHFQENIQFCRIARGSLHELLDHIDMPFNAILLSKVKLSN